MRRELRPDALGALPASLHPVLRRVYAGRGVGADELEPVLARLCPVRELGHVERAAARLFEALERGERVLVVGDFDADGATAAALVVRFLRGLGFVGAGFLVPDRFRFGYGLSPALVEHAQTLAPDLIVTVDNGVASVAGVAAARARGIDVLVTDHHLPGAELPEGAILVNPNLAGEGGRLRTLAGVGVAFYVMAALARRCAAQGREPAVALPELLDLVALGTVADLVPLDFNNRILVAEGLRRIRAGRASAGVRALFAVAGRDPGDATAGDLGFALAPRLNAAGRLTDMALGIECLIEADDARAAGLARRLDALNRERRELQARMEDEARALVRAAARRVDGGGAQCLFDPGWHEGVVGLVATRIKDVVGAPVVAFAPADARGELKGSARSVEGVHVRDLIERVTHREADTVLRFGGHAMAAGLTIRADRLEGFRAAFVAEAERELAGRGRADLLLSDGALAPGELGLELAELLRRSGPWGQRFPEPVFDDHFEVLERRVVGDRHLKLRVRRARQDPGPGLDAIAFNRVELPAGSDRTRRLAYRLDVNEWRAERRAQLVVEAIQSD